MTRKLLKKLSASGNKLNLSKISENRLNRAKTHFQQVAGIAPSSDFAFGGHDEQGIL